MLVPAFGSVETTLPDSTVPEYSWVIGPTVRPASVMALVASSWVLPATSGTFFCSTPRETTAVTACLRRAPSPGPGLQEMTEPSGIVSEKSRLGVPQVSPASSTAFWASSALWPMISGTGTERPGPLRTYQAYQPPAAPPTRSAAAALVGGSAGGWYAWYVLKGPGRSVPVPEIVGQSAEDAQQAVEDAGLTWGTPSRDFSDTIPEGSVISCKPGPGDGARLKQAVTAVVSRGVEQKKVPDVVGKTQDEATKAITDAGLTVGSITQEYSGTVESGKVVSTDPKAGTSINHSSAVAISVSRGRQTATVPDVTGMTVDQAKTTLEAAGLKLGTQTQAFSDTVASGQIISTSPAAGAGGAYHGDTVAVTVSKGPETVSVPDVSGKSEEEAKKALEDLGLKVEVNKRLGGPFGTVRSTDPAAGTSVKAGSTVKINIF